MVKGLILIIIEFYRNYLSPLMLPRCRFSPTCSAYAREAIVRKGVSPGVKMALRRLLRCHPFSRRDYFDPVQ